MAVVAIGIGVAFIGVLVPWLINVLNYTLGRFFYELASIFFKLLDFVQETFRKLAGLESVYVVNDSGNAIPQDDVVLSLLTNNRIVEIVITMTLFAVALLIIATIVQLIRVEYTTEGSKNSKGTVIGASIKALGMFILVPIVCILGVIVSNTLLEAVDRATSRGGSSSIAGTIFLAGMGDTNVVRTGKREWVKGDEFLSGGTGTENKVDEKGDFTIEVDVVDVNGATEGTTTERKNAYEVFNVTQNGNDEINIQTLANAIDSSFSATKSDAVKFDYKNSTYFLHYSNTKAVQTFYNLGSGNYLIIYFASGLALACLLKSCFGLVMRLYKVAALFIISPAVIALHPLDGGAAYKSWRKNFIGAVLGAYGVVISLNLFFFLIGIIKQINLWPVAYGWNPFNFWVQCIFILVGLLMLNDMAKLISGYIGGEEILDAGTKMSKSVSEQAVKYGTKATKFALGGIGIAQGIAGGISKHKLKKNQENIAYNEEHSADILNAYRNTLDAKGQADFDKMSDEDKLNTMNRAMENNSELTETINRASGRKNVLDERKRKNLTISAARGARGLARTHVMFNDAVQGSAIGSFVNKFTGGYIEPFGGKSMVDLDGKATKLVGGEVASTAASSKQSNNTKWSNFMSGMKGVGEHIWSAGDDLISDLPKKGGSNSINANIARLNDTEAYKKVNQAGAGARLTPTAMLSQNNEQLAQLMRDALQGITLKTMDVDTSRQQLEQVLNGLKTNQNLATRFEDTLDQEAKISDLITTIEGELAKSNSEIDLNKVTAKMTVSDIDTITNARFTDEAKVNGKFNDYLANVNNAFNHAISTMTDGAKKAYLKAAKEMDKYDFKIPTGRINKAINDMFEEISKSAAKAATKAAEAANQEKLAKLIGKYSKK